MTLLDDITCPADLRRIDESDLPILAHEIRRRLIDVVERTGGHLGPNLGVVELTLALHRVFESPRDVIIWDTGHQSYVHKMLTGRTGQLNSLRQAGGLSGYPLRTESEHDVVENSHASTALSYLDGVAKAFAIRGEVERCAVAVIGDGAMTGGMCWEALNNIGAAGDRPAIIVLNDNGRSYSPTVGAWGEHLAALRAGTASPLFEQLGFAYLGPVDGHDVAALLAALQKARDLRAPVVVHCVTRKGYGHPPAESDMAEKWHTIPPAGSGGKQTWTDVFSSEIVALGAQRPDIVAISAAMLGPTGLVAFSERFPERTFDVGIAEQHAVTSSAGLAMSGLHPVVCIYSTFLTRALDQVLMDVALHRLPVTFMLDRAGITGPDGPSHHGMWDLSLLGAVPGIRVAAPRDADQLRRQLREAVDWTQGPTVVRYPKANVGEPLPAIGAIGTADLLHEGSDVLVVATGPACADALRAATRLAEEHGLSVAVVDPRWLLPVDADLITAAAAYRLVITIEDSGAHGGYGDSFARAARTAGVRTPLHSVALPQRFLAHGSRADILATHTLDADGIANTIVSQLEHS